MRSRGKGQKLPTGRGGDDIQQNTRENVRKGPVAAKEKVGRVRRLGKRGGFSVSKQRSVKKRMSSQTGGGPGRNKKKKHPCTIETKGGKGSGEKTPLGGEKESVAIWNASEKKCLSF